jgi:cobalt transporter subunit CbtA
MSVVLISGTVAGLILFAIQQFTTFPLIEKAEEYETAAAKKMPGMQHEDQGWQPSDGAERTIYTALTTVVTAIGFAGLLFGVAAMKPISLNWRNGAFLGLAAFVCIDLAPAWGLTPQPPGTAVADLYSRQIWWTATAAATAIGLWLILDRRKSVWIRLSGVVFLIAPHIIGAPVAIGENAVPAELIHQFALFSILTTGIFWITLGSIGGLLYGRSGYAADA